MDGHLVSYYIGISIVIITHLYTFVNPSMIQMSPKLHSVINLVAVLFIAYYFMHKETYIKF